VPSRDGISHNPAEWTDSADIALGVQALARALILADQAF
jgi:acetylornithine deacetylase/succinyl-diaminopimelate desuccinylase-like protein